MDSFRFAACGGLLAAEPGAQTFPARQVRYLMPLPAGSETDFFARALSRQLGEHWNQQVIVENRPGGGTVIATEDQAGTGFWALVARAGTPAEATGKLNADIVKSLQAPDVKTRLAA